MGFVHRKLASNVWTYCVLPHQYASFLGIHLFLSLPLPLLETVLNKIIQTFKEIWVYIEDKFEDTF